MHVKLNLKTVLTSPNISNIECCIIYSCLISGGVVTLKTGRWEVSGSDPGRTCQPRRSEFSVVFSETRLNTG